MKKTFYKNPETDIVLLAPSREMMDPITLGTSNSLSEPAPRRRGVVSFSPNK